MGVEEQAALADVFLTCDGGVLHCATEIERAFGLRVLRPSALVRERRWP
jgi:hypothetical protein